ncbi:uncharacterized protein [Clytia hemisphaerica]|uniref:uncharacterized protein n=1 Tax=Clytia hemisphaerica TaxID=252671 RepID=UPI0034D71BEA
MSDHGSDQEPSTSACPNRFSKKCAAEGHGELPHVTLLSLLNGDSFSKAKRVTAADRVSLVKAGVIKERSRFICRICHKKGLLNKNLENTTSIKKVGKTGVLDQIIPLIDEDIKMLRLEDCNFESLAAYSSVNWVNARPRPVVEFFKKLCSITDVSNTTDIAKMAHAMECIYGCRREKVVLPLSLMTNAVNHAVTHSKQSTMLTSKLTPGGSYTYIQELAKVTAGTPKIIPDVDIKSMVDNGQVLGKNWDLEINSSMPSSVIACHAQIKIPDSRLQWNEKLKPLHYLFGDAEVTESANDEVFKEFRNDFIANRLARFQKTNAVATKVTDERGWYASSLFCKVCNSENHPTASECTTCGGGIEERKYSLDYTNIDDIINVLKNKKPSDMSVNDEADGIESSNNINDFPDKFTDEEMEMVDIDMEVTRGDVFQEIGKNAKAIFCDSDIPKQDGLDSSIFENCTINQRVQEPCEMFCGEPDLMNPNSYDHLTRILRNHGTRSGIRRYGRGEREWLLLEVDGTIFQIVVELINNTYACRKCNDSHFGLHYYKVWG